MSNRADGTYPGSIVAAYVTEDSWNKGEYVLKLDVNLEGGGAVTCRVKLSASDTKEQRRRDGTLKELGLPYPFKSDSLLDLPGKGIDVRLKTSAKGNQNAYVASPFDERVLTPEEIDAAMSGANDEIPF